MGDIKISVVRRTFSVCVLSLDLTRSAVMRGFFLGDTVSFILSSLLFLLAFRWGANTGLERVAYKIGLSHR